eukprot:TRINITY_DN381_c0_g1_i2.p2 TRINITY_DN381_c0_g1~~TRINITY_DN381_c0_g1_i2.p2  ORF type:complete len:191 (-),score=69.12 TRINITY_DN381_c0_g1_i2:54-578(-)
MAKLMALRTMPVEESTIFIHPRLFSLTSLSPEVGEADAEGVVALPPACPLSSERLEPRGLLLLETTMGIYFYVGRAIPPTTLSALFGVTNLAEIPFSLVALPQLDNEYSVKVRAVVAYLQRCHSWPQWLHVCRESDETEKRFFCSFLIGDRSLGFLSYSEFLSQLQKQVDLTKK